jgi:hypothetical protein
MHRKIELWIVWITAVISTLLMELFQTLGAWFGVTVIIMLVLSVLGTFFLVSRKNLLAGSVCFILAGIDLLLGSQLVAFIPAFPFFVSGVLALNDYIVSKKED